MLKKTLVPVFCFVTLLSLALNVLAEEKKEEPKWKTRFEFSYVKTSGNTDTQTLSGRLGVRKEGEINRYFLNGFILYGESEDEETANKSSLDARWERTFTDRLFGFLVANYLRDKFSGYQYRIGGGPGAGYDIVKSEKHQLKGFAAVLYYYDRFYQAAETSDSYASGRIGADYLWQILENLKFRTNASYLVSFKDSDKYFIDSETALETKIRENLSLGVSYIIAYQNQLPSPGLKHTDTTFLTSLIIDF